MNSGDGRTAVPEFCGAGLRVGVGDGYELLLAWERLEVDIDSIKVGLLTRFRGMTAVFAHVYSIE